MRQLDIRPIKGRDGRTTQQSKRALDVRSQNLQCSDNSGVPAGRQAVSVGAPHQDRARSQAKRFHNVSATADSSIHEHFDLTIYGGDNFRKSAQGRKN
jgi:hypothetical protein